MTPIRTPLVSALLAIALTPAVAAEHAIDLSLGAGKADEACMKLRVGDTLQWRFDAEAPVAFNVHHHVGKDVMMPVELKEARRHEGRLVADVANDWCLMWTAAEGTPARVKGSWSITPKP
jgi:hypothetical protein